MEKKNYNIDEQFKTMLIIWGAFLNSQLLFLAVIYFAKPEAFEFDLSKPLLGDGPILQIAALGAMAVGGFIASFFFRKQYIGQAVGKQDPLMVQTAMILGIAFCEVSSILGLMLAFLEANQIFLAWFALGIIGIILHFPRKADLMDATSRKTI